MLTKLLILPVFYLGWVEAGCDCTFNQDNGEVVCDPGTQEGIYWDLPECLDVPDYAVCLLYILVDSLNYPLIA